jgi:hypothetical protein
VKFLGIKLTRRTRKFMRLHAFAIATTVTTLALVAGLLNSTRAYFHCSAMDMTTLESCCVHADEKQADNAASSDAATIGNDDSSCCELRSFGTTAPVVEADAVSFPPAPFAILPTLPFPKLVLAMPPTRRGGLSTRAGPTATSARAQLQVYLC